jgi:subtilisin family serine protease
VTVHRARIFAVGAAVSVAVFVSQLAPVAAATPPANGNHGERGAGRTENALLVQLKPGVNDAAAAALFARFGSAEVGRVDQLSTRVVVSNGNDKAALRRQLESSALVASVEDDGSAQVTLTPNDPLWSNEWFARKVRAPLAWDTTVGAGAPVIAVLDTGVQAWHPDLAGRVLQGRDFVNNDAYANDDMGHGTMVAGVAAGAGMNGKGVAGVCWRCKILPVKVANSHGSVRWSNVAAGITWAAKHGANVINMSFGGNTGSSMVANAVAFARSMGVVVVAAAGNEGNTMRFYPAAYRGVLSVAATTSSDHLYSFSTRGSWVKLAAPGCTWTTQRGSQWGSFCGTSAAAPIVAGTAGLVMSAMPGASRYRVEQRILNKAVYFTSAIGGGRVDTAASVGSSSSTTPPPPDPDPTPTTSACPNQNRDGGSGTMEWEGDLSASQMSVDCTIKLAGWTRLSASWNAPDGIRFQLRNSSGRVVLEVRGDGTNSGRDDHWLSSGTYRLSVTESSQSEASFTVKLSWHSGD